MHKVYFYKDRNGNEPVRDYIQGLSDKKDKNSRIKFNKIRDYIKVLSEFGTEAGKRHKKHRQEKLKRQSGNWRI